MFKRRFSVWFFLSQKVRFFSVECFHEGGISNKTQKETFQNTGLTPFIMPLDTGLKVRKLQFSNLQEPPGWPKKNTSSFGGGTASWEMHLWMDEWEICGKLLCQYGFGVGPHTPLIWLVVTGRNPKRTSHSLGHPGPDYEKIPCSWCRVKNTYLIARGYINPVAQKSKNHSER